MDTFKKIRYVTGTSLSKYKEFLLYIVTEGRRKEL